MRPDIWGVFTAVASYSPFIQSPSDQFGIAQVVIGKLADFVPAFGIKGREASGLCDIGSAVKDCGTDSAPVAVYAFAGGLFQFFGNN